MYPEIVLFKNTNFPEKTYGIMLYLYITAVFTNSAGFQTEIFQFLFTHVIGLHWSGCQYHAPSSDITSSSASLHRSCSSLTTLLGVLRYIKHQYQIVRGLTVSKTAN